MAEGCHPQQVEKLRMSASYTLEIQMDATVEWPCNMPYIPRHRKIKHESQKAGWGWSWIRMSIGLIRLDA
jgi:hypothetical protein